MTDYYIDEQGQRHKPITPLEGEVERLFVKYINYVTVNQYSYSREIKEVGKN